MSSFSKYLDAIAGRRLPLAMVDLEAFDGNLARMLAPIRQYDKGLRLATKSIRCIELMNRARALCGDSWAGLMSFSVEESQHLVKSGFRDILLAYPTMQRSDLELLGRLNEPAEQRVAMVIDGDEHLDHIVGILGKEASEEAEIPLMLDVDASYQRLGGHLYLGARRSGLRGNTQIIELAKRIIDQPGVRFAGLMAYEAQIAGLPDRSQVQRWQNPIKSFIRQTSRKDIKRRRAAIADAFSREKISIGVFNGGGTASVEWTSEEPAITEVAVGSAGLCGHLFDSYSNTRLEPAAFFALQVCRRPGPGWVTCLGGGYVASGAPGVDRLPKPVFPEGLQLSKGEGPGEVQTPLYGKAADALSVGEAVLFRHAKSGELAEHFDQYLLIDSQGEVEAAPTYRGQGFTFM